MSELLVGSGGGQPPAGEPEARPMGLGEILRGADQDGRSLPWYRRRGILVALVVAAVVVITVVTDLPQPTTRSSSIADEAAVVKSINTYLLDCSTSVTQALQLRGYALEANLPSSDRMRIPGLLRDDEAACTVTNNDTLTLASIQAPGTPAGKQMGRAVQAVSLWATSDATTVVLAIEQLTASRASEHQPKALSQLNRGLRYASADRAKALDDVRAAGALLDTTLPAPKIPALPKAAS